MSTLTATILLFCVFTAPVAVVHAIVMSVKYHRLAGKQKPRKTARRVRKFVQRDLDALLGKLSTEVVLREDADEEALEYAAQITEALTKAKKL
jgi:uncharacterized paraquat-inducible protein A